MVGMFAGSDEPVVGILRGSMLEPILLRLHSGNSILFNVSVGYLTSVFFWFLVVFLPERSRRNLLRDNLSRHYRAFRENTIQVLLWASVGSHDSELPKELCNHRRFREFFDKNGKERWYAALNGLQGDSARISDVLLELELFSA